MLAARIAAGRRFRLGVDFAEIDALRAQSFIIFTLVEREIYSTSKLLVHVHMMYSSSSHFYAAAPVVARGAGRGVLGCGVDRCSEGPYPEGSCDAACKSARTIYTIARSS